LKEERSSSMMQDPEQTSPESGEKEKREEDFVSFK
jgi:hypothetical protein